MLVTSGDNILDADVDRLCQTSLPRRNPILTEFGPSLTVINTNFHTVTQESEKGLG